MTPTPASLRLVLLSTLMLMVVTTAGVISGYQLSRRLTMDVGEFGDGPFLSGFYADEPDIGYRYRWTRGHAEVSFAGAGSAAPFSVVIRAQGARPAPASTSTSAPAPADHSQPVTMSVTLNGVPLDPPTVALSSDVRDYAFRVPLSSGGGAPHLHAPYTLALDVPTFRPPNDARDLGIKVDRVELAQVSTGVNWPPLYILLWTLLMVGALFALLQRWAWAWAWAWAPALPPVLSLAGAVLVCLWIGASVMYATAYLPWVAATLAVAALLAYVRPLRWWPIAEAGAEADSVVRWKPARWIMLAALAVYAVVALWCILQVDWIGHADYAENAVVARNLVEGRGLVVDYVAQFYRYYPGITHPADTWPLLQPLLIAPFFVLFGPHTWAAKLPNLLVMLALGWGVFTAASRLWDCRAGLLAGLLVLAHPYFFNAVLYPINDLPFAAIFFALAWLVWLVWRPQTSEAGAVAEHAFNGRREYMLAALTGVLAGLLVWSKPSGAVLLIGVGLWVALAWLWRWGRVRLQSRGAGRNKGSEGAGCDGTVSSPSSMQSRGAGRNKGSEGGEGERLPWRCVLVAGVVAGLVLLPLMVRNLLAFGVPFYSTESYDAWILRYWPYYQWENIYRVYAGGELPHPRWVVGGKFGYQNLIDAFAINLRWVWDRGVMEDPGEGEYVVGPLALLGAAVGVAVLSRRAVGLFGMVGLSVDLYAAFVLIYWHFEGRYFQVAVPWLYMLVAWGLIWLWDRGRARLPVSGLGRVLRQAALILPVGGMLAVAWPHLWAISGQIATDTRPTGFVDTMRWLAHNSAPTDVVMTRDPWELNWYTRRKAVMIPYEDLPTIERIARIYGVTMLQLGGPVDRVDVSRCPSPDAPSPGSFPTGSRPALDGLYCGRQLPGYTLVFQQGGGTIYRLEPGN